MFVVLVNVVFVCVCRLEFEDSEVVVGMQVVRLNSEASAGMTSYFALCTCTDHGEEVTVRSKVGTCLGLLFLVLTC